MSESGRHREWARKILAALIAVPDTRKKIDSDIDAIAAKLAELEGDAPDVVPAERYDQDTTKAYNQGHEDGYAEATKDARYDSGM